MPDARRRGRVDEDRQVKRCIGLRRPGAASGSSDVEVLPRRDRWPARAGVHHGCVRQPLRAIEKEIAMRSGDAVQSTTRALLLVLAGCSVGAPSGFSGGDHWTFPLVGPLEDGLLITPA